MRSARGDELTARQLEAILALRVAVFVVEQDCPYQEVDGRDTLRTTWHVWTGDVDACLRVLTEPDGTRRIGRVCTAEKARGSGLAAELMRAALVEIGDAPSVLDAQTYARGFYERFGFAAVGAEFDEDGIPHIRMERAARTSG
ncbi:GNAT family N-acetyltransferase [Pseudonocardia sp. WMMC193]|uniref:GNAT family N-acetyltransferase n=1 Tax=Pseudonocardia sp. WMMC193 TaxID=2911965 RepID=UPI001F0019B9|nr:GNAT family N-acetyltransferase [Pseudonocardia sp. WMMC193]MCF7552402.1 GNAT family N-acetyltransferase [Pseudonocardia sp. WMMC193]